MATEDEGQAKEIPLATAQPVHAHLGSWWNRQPHRSDVCVCVTICPDPAKIPYHLRVVSRWAAGQQTNDGVSS
jgi:hypothetical protein